MDLTCVFVYSYFKPLWAMLTCLGPQTEEFIDKIQEARDEAAESLRGQGVALLCRLDLMHFELSITEAEEKLRDELYEALRQADEVKIKELMSGSTAEAVRALPTDGETPYLARARRTIAPRDGQYSILRGAARALLDGQTMWAGIVHDLEGLLAISDDAGVYRSFPLSPSISFPRCSHYIPSLATLLSPLGRLSSKLLAKATVLAR